MRQILVWLERLVRQLESGQREKYIPQIKAIRQRLSYPDMKLAVIGNFSCGKSTFLNAVLKTPLLTMDVMPTTAVPTYIDWNEESDATVVSVSDIKGVRHPLDETGRRWFRETAGRDLPEDMGEMLDYLTTTNALTPVLSKIGISFPEKNGRKGFCIVDTPGVNPGDEEASDHILKTQAVLREEADAAIVLFPSYCVYTRDFQDFLDQNAKHLLADSIFVVTKMDMVPSEKERGRLIHFVKGRLEERFELEDVEVFGCSAGCALDYYTGHAAGGEAWADSFEQMLEDVFRELQGRRNRIVTEKTKKMLRSLISELQTEMKEQQDALLKTRQSFTTYSYENLKKEYRSGLEPYCRAIQSAAYEQRNGMKNVIAGEVGKVMGALAVEANSAKNARQLNKMMETVFQKKIQELEKDLEKQSTASLQSLNNEMNRKYAGLMTAMQRLLERYQYHVGEFETFTAGRRNTEKTRGLSREQEISNMSAVMPRMENRTGSAAAITAVAFVLFGVIGALASWALHSFAFSRQREKAVAQIREGMENYAAAVTRQYNENVQSLETQYNQAGENLLMAYIKEYKTFFQEKEEKMEAYKAEIEKQIEKNEQMLAAMDEMSRFIAKAASRSYPV